MSMERIQPWLTWGCLILVGYVAGLLTNKVFGWFV